MIIKRIFLPLYLKKRRKGLSASVITYEFNFSQVEIRTTDNTDDTDFYAMTKAASNCLHRWLRMVIISEIKKHVSEIEYP